MKTIFKYFLIITLLSSISLWANGNVSLTGVITDIESGDPVVNAMVHITGTQLHDYTDSLGIFTIPDVKAGNYQLQVMRLGYKSLRREIEFAPGVGQLTITLKPLPVIVEDILVTGSVAQSFPQSDIYKDAVDERNPSNVGEFLNSQTGFAAVRRGGYSVDPVMRGNRDEQLNIQYDGGVKVSFACPNRMDPVTSHIQAEDLEKIEVIKGPYSVRYGQTFGGIVNLVQKRPAPADHFSVHGEMESGYESISEGRRARAALSASGKMFDFYASGGSKDYGNYQSGAGAEVPSSFKVNDYSLRLGVNPSANHRVQLGWRQSFVRDVRHAGLPMDTNYDDTDIWSLDYAGRGLGRKIFSLNAKAYGSQVSHLMTNRLRPNYMMVHAETPVSSDMLGGKIEIGGTLSAKNIFYIGADWEKRSKDGARTREVFTNPCTGMMMNPSRTFTDAIWQDSEISDFGVFSEIRQILNPKLTAVAGVRIDAVSSKINDPAVQFTAEYGNFEDINETNISANLSFNYTLNTTTNLQLAMGRGTRTANLIERYINHLSIGVDPHEYVGNPNLKPEVNHQVDLSLDKQIGALSLTANAFYSLAQDYITASVDENLSRLYLPCREPQQVKRYHNIDRARQMGFELNLRGKAMENISYRVAAAYTRADDLARNDPLPEIPPLEANLAVRYSQAQSHYWAELSGRFVARQDRISEAFSETETPGFSTFNFLTGFKMASFAEINIGVINILDENYYEHLNRKYRNMPTQEILYEPGRNFTVNLKLRK